MAYEPQIMNVWALKTYDKKDKTSIFAIQLCVVAKR